MYIGQLISMVLVALFACKPVESALSVEQMEKAAASMRNSCVEKIGVDMSLVMGMKNGEFPNDTKLKCYTNCIMKKLRTYKNGAIDVDMVQKQVDAMMQPDRAARVKVVAQNCASRATSPDPCENTYEYVECYYKSDPEVYFFP